MSGVFDSVEGEIVGKQVLICYGDVTFAGRIKDVLNGNMAVPVNAKIRNRYGSAAVREGDPPRLDFDCLGAYINLDQVGAVFVVSEECTQ